LGDCGRMREDMLAGKEAKAEGEGGGGGEGYVGKKGVEALLVGVVENGYFGFGGEGEGEGEGCGGGFGGSEGGGEDPSGRKGWWRILLLMGVQEEWERNGPMRRKRVRMKLPLLLLLHIVLCCFISLMCCVSVTVSLSCQM